MAHRFPLASPRPLLRSALVALCLSAPLVSAAALAQTDGETEIARQRFREGVAHYDRQDFEKARLAFLQAYLLRPHPAVLLNLAQSELRAGRHAEAAENFAKYLRENPSAPAAENAKTGLEEARKRVTELSVQVNAAGAAISVDGAEIGRSPLPHAVYLMPGRHAVSARKGEASADRVLDAVAGRREYITLELQEGFAQAASPAAASPMLPQLGASAAGSAAPEVDSGAGQGFFSWIGSSPAAVATVSVAGLALGTSAVLAGFAANRYSAANNVRSQIMNALQREVSRGYVGPDSVACGSDGIANNNVQFLVPISDAQRTELTGRYNYACQLFDERSDSGDRLKTLSLVSLGVGAFAALGTVVWYFSDAEGGGSADSGVAPKQGRASLTPLLSAETQGVLFEMTF